MKDQLYFDDPDEGPSRGTSHPTFVRVCDDELFYDSTDDLGPFGNDEGADVLYELQDWYREGAKGTLRAFIDRMLEKWDGMIHDLAITDRATVNQWLEDEELASALLSADSVVIASAFGAAKISGKLDESVAALARAALQRHALVVEHQQKRDPKWPHSAPANAAIAAMRVALEKLEKKRAG